MKNIRYLILFFLINFHFYVNAQTIENKIDSLMSDTIGLDEFYKQNFIEIIERYEIDLKKNNLLFPFSEFDSVVFYTLNDKYFETENIEYLSFIVDFKSKKLGNSVNRNGKKLTDTQSKYLLEIINSPFSYQFGYSATPFPKYGFVFYLKGNIIAYFDLDSNNCQINVMYPNLYLTKEGSFKINTSKIISNFLKDLYTFE